jgi:hypothetical protein
MLHIIVDPENIPDTSISKSIDNPRTEDHLTGPWGRRDFLTEKEFRSLVGLLGDVSTVNILAIDRNLLQRNGTRRCSRTPRQSSSSMISPDHDLHCKESKVLSGSRNVNIGDEVCKIVNDVMANEPRNHALFRFDRDVLKCLVKRDLSTLDPLTVHTRHPLNQYLPFLPKLGTALLHAPPRLCPSFNDVGVEHAGRVVLDWVASTACPSLLGALSPAKKHVASPFQFRSCLLNFQGVDLMVLLAAMPLFCNCSRALGPGRERLDATGHFDVTGKNCSLDSPFVFHTRTQSTSLQRMYVTESIHESSEFRTSNGNSSN